LRGQKPLPAFVPPLLRFVAAAARQNLQRRAVAGTNAAIAAFAFR
jgi:hypothetical protein